MDTAVSCEAGAAENGGYYSDPRPRGGARGTARRDPSVTAHDVWRKVATLWPILFCHHTPAARNRPNSPWLLGARVPDRCRFPYHATP